MTFFHRTALVVLAALALAPSAQADTWVQHNGPVLTASTNWEGGRSLQEPIVRYEKGKFRMWYRAGWNWCGIGYAESRDGKTWTKRMLPVFGGPGENACHPSITKHRGTYYMYFRRNFDLYVATSPNGIQWTMRPTPVLVAGDWDFILANTHVWVEKGQWRMMYEAMNTKGLWFITLADGTDPFSFVKRPFGQLDGLSVGGMFGGPQMTPLGIFYHASAVVNSNLPTDIYHATKVGAGFRTERVVWREQPWQFDQVADPSVVVGPGGRVFMFFDGVNNITEDAGIGMAELTARS